MMSWFRAATAGYELDCGLKRWGKVMPVRHPAGNCEPYKLVNRLGLNVSSFAACVNLYVRSYRPGWRALNEGIRPRHFSIAQKPWASQRTENTHMETYSASRISVFSCGMSK